MSSTAQSKYYETAENALAELDSEKADKLFLDLVLAIEEAVNKNQKDVASELQRLAKEIESAGKLSSVPDALRFKQRTCEVMLRRSMAERRRNSQTGQQPVVPPETKLLSQMIFVCFTKDPQTHAIFLQNSGLNSELRVLPDGSRWMRSKDSQLILVAKHAQMNGACPLFVAPSQELAVRRLQLDGHTLDGESLEICGMKLLMMKDKTGQRFLLAGAEILQNI